MGASDLYTIIDKIGDRVHWSWIKDNKEALALIVIGAIYLLNKLYIYLHNANKQIKVDLDLHPVFDEDDVKHYTEIFIPTKFQFESPTKGYDPHSQYRDRTKREHVIDKFEAIFLNKHGNLLIPSLIAVFNKKKYSKPIIIERLFFQLFVTKFLHDVIYKLLFGSVALDVTYMSRNRFILVLADTGMGKTAFMVNLYLRYAARKRKKYNIVLLRFTQDNVDTKIKEIPDKKNVILLLDGLDEDSKAIENADARKKELLQIIQDFRRVVISCRTQFFTHESYEWNTIDILNASKKGGYSFEKIFISPFDNNDIEMYLSRKYNKDKKKYAQAIKIVEKIPFIMVRPLILSYMDDFVGGKESFDYLIDIYSRIVEKWIEREIYLTHNDQKPLFRLNMLRFSTQIAQHLYEHPENDLMMRSIDIDIFAKENNISLTSFESKSKSLLNRGEKDQYKFAHKSFLEYFLSLVLYNNPSFLFYKFETRGYDAAFTFYKEKCIKYHTVPFLQNIAVGAKREIYINDRDTMSTRLYEQLGIAKNCTLNATWTIGKHSHLNWIAFLANIQSLTLSNQNYLEDEKVFIPFDNLKTLTIDSCNVTSLEFVKFLNLSTVILKNSTITDEVIEYVKIKSPQTLVVKHF